MSLTSPLGVRDPLLYPITHCLIHSMHLICMTLLHIVQFSHPLVASGTHGSRGTTKQSLSGLPLSFAFFAIPFFLVRFHHLRHPVVLCLTSMSNVH